MIGVFTLAALFGELSLALIARNHHQHHHQHLHDKRGIKAAAAAPLASPVVTINVPHDPPGNASPRMDPTFPAFAFEETSFYQYAGQSCDGLLYLERLTDVPLGPGGQPNQFSRNCLNQIAMRTNVRPVVRVGGTSLDESSYNRNQQQAFTANPNQIGNVPRNVVVGPSYFQSFKNFGSAQYIFCLPLANKNLQNTINFAKDGYKVIKPQLFGLEIGNEPQFYPGEVRPVGYTPQDYVQEFTRFSNAVNQALGLPNNRPLYEGVALGSPRQYGSSDAQAAPGPFYPNNLYSLGLRNLAPRFQSVSLHYYQTFGNNDGSHYQLRDELLNHTVTVTKTNFFRPAIQYFRQNHPNIPVVLAEVASSLNGASNDYGLESVFGAALWQVDWMLYAASIGIRRINWQQISASAFDLWQPTNYRGRVPAVLPPFYAMLFVADLIGPNAASTPIRIANVDLGIDKLTAYVAYGTSYNVPVRIALINMRFFSGNESPSNPRKNQPVRLRLPTTVKSVTVQRLHSVRGATAGTGVHGGDDQIAGISWMGMQYSYESEGMAQRVREDTSMKVVEGGVVEVMVSDSEAVMVFCNY